MKEYLKLIDRDTPGNRCDVTPLFKNYQLFGAMIDDIVSQIEGPIDFVAGIDALGFIFGFAIAQKLQVGFIPIRKGGKLPVETDKISFVDYSETQKELELRKNCIEPNAKMLIADEWVETGSQIKAAIELVEKQKGVVAGIATINFDLNEITNILNEKYKVYSIMKNSSDFREEEE